jgi:hypothetical protein
MAERPLVEQLDQVIESLLGGVTPPRTGHTELAALAEVANGLRQLPSKDFKRRLKTELQRRMAMTAGTEVRATDRRS